MSNPTRLELVHSYRHMYRALLRAVQYSKPARYTARDQLRDGYRNRKRHNFDRNKIERTIEFLNGAARETGLEHRILRNLISTRFHLAYSLKPGVQHRGDFYRKDGTLNASGIKETAFVHYDMTLAMLNDSMGLCLR